MCVPMYQNGIPEKSYIFFLFSNEISFLSTAVIRFHVTSSVNNSSDQKHYDSWKQNQYTDCVRIKLFFPCIHIHIHFVNIDDRIRRDA